MRVLRPVPNVPSPNLAQSRRFYGEALGYSVVMDPGWIVTFASPANPAAQVSALGRDTDSG